MKTEIEVDDGLIPEGWELVRVGKPADGDKVIVRRSGEICVDDGGPACSVEMLIVRPKPKPLTIAAGKRYVTRGGEVMGPMRPRGVASMYRWAYGDGTWKDDGGYSNETSPHVLDIIAEYVESEPKYRPFANKAEFAPHRERWLREKHGRHFGRATGFSDKTLWAMGERTALTWPQLLDAYVFDDTGLPCGVME